MSRAFTIQFNNLDSDIKKKMLHYYMQSNPEIVIEYLDRSLIGGEWDPHKEIIDNHVAIKDKFVEYANSNLFRTRTLARLVSNPKLLDKVSVPTREADIYVEKINALKEPTMDFAYIWIEERVQLYRVDNRYYLSQLVIDEKFDRLMYTNDLEPNSINIYKLPWDTTKSLDTYALEALIAMQFRDYLAEKEILK